MNERETPELVYAYTVVIFIMAGLAMLMIASHEMLANLMMQDEKNAPAVWIMRFLQSIELIYSILGIVVGVLRVRQSPLALPTTAALSILLIGWPPFGTAAFCYWFFSVRRRERCEQTNRTDGA